MDLAHHSSGHVFMRLPSPHLPQVPGEPCPRHLVAAAGGRALPQWGVG